MNFHVTKSFRWVAAFAVLAAWSVAAQQPIIFSKPADADGAAKPDPNVAPEKKHETRSFFSIPMSVFEPTHSTPSLAPFSGGAPVPQASSEQLKSWQKVLDTKNRWTLMTPEEILGIPTPEKILGLPSKDGMDDLSPELRFTKRRDKAAAALFETAVAPDKMPARSDTPLSSNQSPFARKTFESVFSSLDEKPANASSPTAGASVDGKGGSIFSSLVSGFSSADKPDPRWGNSFNFPVPPPKPTPQQLAGMDRFRESLQPAAVFQSSAEVKRPAATVLRDPFMNATPDFNPHGSSYTPLKSDVARPMGLTPLPGITTRLPVTPKRSASAPELPPWLRDDSSGAPQRKF